MRFGPALPVLAFALVAIALSRRAEAAPEGAEPLRLVWTAPDECPPASVVRERILARLPKDASVTATARVDRVKGRYHLVLRVGSKGERVLDAETCDAIVDSVSVVVAMSMGPVDAAAAADAPASPATEAATPSTSPTTSEARAPAITRGTETPSKDTPAADTTSAQRDREGLVTARANVAADVGTLPSAAIGGGIAIGLDPISRLHLEANAELWGAQQGTAAADPSRGARFDLLTFGARACFALTRVAELAPCVGVELSRVAASGFGAAQVADATSIAWAPEVGAMLRIRAFGPLSFRAGLAALFPTSRQTFVITSVGPVHRPDAVAVRGWLGPEVRF